MRRVSVLLVALVSHLMVWAQGSEGPTEQSALLFDEVEWDFGTINEVDGKVSHTFRYRNISDGFVTIERVYSSCGCTSGDYSRRPLKAGGEGEFVVTFDPTDRGGKVDKTVTLTYDKGRGRTELRIKGRVKARPRSVEDTHPYELGRGIRSDSSFKPFGRVAQGSTKSMTLALVNTSRRSVELGVQWEKQSGMLDIELPIELAPGESALATLTYRPSALGEEHSGLVIDEFRVLIDGEPSEELFRTSAVVELSGENIPQPTNGV